MSKINKNRFVLRKKLKQLKFRNSLIYPKILFGPGRWVGRLAPSMPTLISDHRWWSSSLGHSQRWQLVLCTRLKECQADTAMSLVSLVYLTFHTYALPILNSRMQSHIDCWFRPSDRSMEAIWHCSDLGRSTNCLKLKFIKIENNPNSFSTKHSHLSQYCKFV